MTPVQIARTQIHVTEETGSNDHVMIDCYLNRIAHPGRLRPAREQGLSWCAAFILWCYWQAGREIKGNFWKMRAVSALETQLLDDGCSVGSISDLEPGDLITWARKGGSGHVAMVTQAQGAIAVIAGNETFPKTKIQGVREYELTEQRLTSARYLLRPSKQGERT